MNAIALTADPAKSGERIGDYGGCDNQRGRASCHREPGGDGRASARR